MIKFVEFEYIDYAEQSNDAMIFLSKDRRVKFSHSSIKLSDEKFVKNIYSISTGNEKKDWIIVLK